MCEIVSSTINNGYDDDQMANSTRCFGSVITVTSQWWNASVH